MEAIEMGDVTGGGTTFGGLLKELREAAGLSQGELAERAGMNLYGVAKLEQGKREPSWATVQALAVALGVSCERFVSDTAASATPPRPKGRPKKAAAGQDVKAEAAAPAPEAEAPAQKPARPKGKKARQGERSYGDQTGDKAKKEEGK